MTLPLGFVTKCEDTIIYGEHQFMTSTLLAPQVLVTVEHEKGWYTNSNGNRDFYEEVNANNLQTPTPVAWTRRWNNASLDISVYELATPVSRPRYARLPTYGWLEAHTEALFFRKDGSSVSDDVTFYAPSGTTPQAYFFDPFTVQATNGDSGTGTFQADGQENPVLVGIRRGTNFDAAMGYQDVIDFIIGVADTISDRVGRTQFINFPQAADDDDDGSGIGLPGGGIL